MPIYPQYGHIYLNHIFAPLRMLKKGFLAIISKSVTDSDLKLWSAQPNVTIANILVSSKSFLSQKEVEISAFKVLPYTQVKKG